LAEEKRRNETDEPISGGWGCHLKLQERCYKPDVHFMDY
jgi:hypothetical protein